MVNSGNNYQKVNDAFRNEDMKTSLPQQSFDGIFPPEKTVFVCSLTSKDSFLTMNELIEPTGFLGWEKSWDLPLQT